MSEPIVVTGIGLITPVGVGVDRTWAELLAGTSGVKTVESFDTGRYKVHLGGEVHGFEPREFGLSLDADQAGRASLLAASAARLALADAGFDPSAVDPVRSGVAMGTTSGEPKEVELFDDRYIAEELESLDGRFATLYPCHVIAAHVACEVGFAGPNAMIPTACAAGSFALAHATEVLQAGRADVMLAGGADSLLAHHLHRLCAFSAP